jgi:ubiquinone/menaquinone biosynthesis C-methylase UbiE
LNLVARSAENLEYSSEFDLITINGSLEHVHDFREALHNSLRALKPDGFILIEGWGLAQAQLCGSYGHNQKRFLDTNSLAFLFKKFGIRPIFIESENLCGPSRPGATYAFGTRKFI